MSAQSIGLAVIARDEEATLPRLLRSISGAFDQVALLDTGSTDRTVEVFEEWAAAEKERQPGFVSTLGHFTWCDDFAAARNAADDLVEADWWCWADCDDVIEGATRLRSLAETDPKPDLLAFRYDLGPGGQVFRARLRRAGCGRWHGRLHEGIGIQEIGFGPEDIRWRHEKSAEASGRSARRNRDILRRWAAEEPLNLRPLGMLAWSEVMSHDRGEGIRLLRRYIDIRWAHCEDEIATREREAARWALRELELAAARDTGLGEPPGVRRQGPEVFLQITQLALTAIIGLCPDSIMQTLSISAQDLRNPEPADLPDYLLGEARRRANPFATIRECRGGLSSRRAVAALHAPQWSERRGGWPFRLSAPVLRFARMLRISVRSLVASKVV